MFLSTACSGVSDTSSADQQDQASGCSGADCVAAECPKGTLGCICYGNATCNNGADGAQLACTGTICQAFVETLELCPVGSLGCKCLPNGTCSASPAGLLGCLGEICGPATAGTCTEGDLNCACYPNATCNLDENADPLQCQGKLCVSPGSDAMACPTGTAGCPCYPNASCGQAIDGIPLECVGTTCSRPDFVEGDCLTGTLGCPCFGNASCYLGPAGQTLTCIGTTCEVPPVSEDCSDGDIDCPCYANGTCNVDKEGDILVCSEATCSLPTDDCVPGSLACACTPSGSCGAGLVCLGVACIDAPEIPSLCPEGLLGCPCAAAGNCATGLICQGTTCVQDEAPCPAGELGCACLGNGTCGPDLSCNNTLCETSQTTGTCDVGTLGCPCAGNGACGTGPGGQALICIGVTCEIDEAQAACTVGDLYCGCKNSGACDNGLVCGATFVCIVPTCINGQLGCACKSSGPDACDQSGTFCDQDGTCQSSFCLRGVAGCGCKPNGSCDAGLGCQLGVCTFDEQLGPVAPENPSCYTPCSAGKTTTSGTWVACDDGLMAGCLNGQTCFEGSCLENQLIIESDLTGIPPQKPSCGSDGECPAFQACLQGGCYSNCELDSQCNAGHICFGKTCKKGCTTSGNECPGGTFCSSDDGATGVCMPAPNITPQTPAVDVSAYRFELAGNTLSFDAMLNRTQIAVLNYGPSPVNMVVRKLQHSFYDSEGITVVDQGSLAWVEMGPFTDAVDKVQSFQMEIGAAVSTDEPGSRQIKIDKVDASSLISWDGILEFEGFVGDTSIGKRRLRLTYRGNADGIWRGQIVSFANFSNVGLDAWVKGPDGNHGTADDRYATAGPAAETQAIQDIQNAFVKRWLALKQGEISIDEFSALLSQTVEGSWNWNNVKSRCPNEQNPDYGQGCYLYDDPNVDTDTGVVPYSASLTADPVPSGAVSLPIALNLKANGNDPTLWEGRIESSVAMHYPGNPALSVRFQNDPYSCDNAGLGKGCLAYLDGMNANIISGGRYESVAGACPDGQGFEIQSFPWLLSDFVPEYVAGSGLAQHCVFTQLPYGASTLVQSANKALTAAVPVPNGRSVRRNFRLVDGAMINQREMVILFEEAFSNPFSDTLGADLSTYGVLILERSPEVAQPTTFDGNAHAEFAPAPALEPTGKLDLQCSPAVLDKIAEAVPDITLQERLAIKDGTFTVDKGLLKKVALTSVFGTAALLEDASTFCVDGECDAPAAGEWTAHYFCEDTGLIDGGDDPVNPIPCPHGSNVVYFATRGDLGILGAHLENLPCQLNQLSANIEFSE
ncbi:MAG: hypothetical protein ACI9OJ_003766, partial [Myxococcota bacterium]